MSYMRWSKRGNRCLNVEDFHVLTRCVTIGDLKLGQSYDDHIINNGT